MVVCRQLAVLERRCVVFELKFIISAKTINRRIDLLEEAEKRLRQQFPTIIVDVSRWGFDAHPIENEFLVSVNYRTSDPHKLRVFVTNTLRHRAVNLTNLVTKKRYPLNREQRRVRQNKRR
jgi:hypothetical protein